MKCPKCMSRLKVKDSRHADSTWEVTRGLRKKTDAAVGWYTADWVARHRICANPKCRHSMITVEISIEDLAAGWAPRDG